MIHESTYELKKDVEGVLEIADGKVSVVDVAALQSNKIDTLVHDAVFGNDSVKELAQWVICKPAKLWAHARPASMSSIFPVPRTPGKTVPSRP